MGTKIKLLLLLNHLLLIFGIFHFGAWNLIYTLLGYVLIIKLGVECGFHRLFSHKAYRTGSFRQVLLLFLGTLAGIGSSIAWVGVHRLHHRYSDTDQDPHGDLPAYRVWLTFWREFVITPQIVRDLLTNKWHLLFHRHYFKILLFSYVLIGALNIKLLIFGICGASVFGFHAAGLINTVCHRLGERRFALKDQSRNNILINLLVGGNGLHNNHHANPSAWDFRTQKWDIDVQAYLIKCFLMVSD